MERLLLVDDDAPFRERLARALGARGHAVTTAAGLDAAVALSKTGDFTGFVVDLRLGTDSGLSLVGEWHARLPATPIVVLTGFGSIATALEAVRLGARDYLTKPVDPDHVLLALRGERDRRGAPPEAEV
jgi:two-component system response regulator RegA